MNAHEEVTTLNSCHTSPQGVLYHSSHTQHRQHHAHLQIPGKGKIKSTNYPGKISNLEKVGK